jgi:hypothetical protein
MLTDQSMTIKEFLQTIFEPYDSCAEPEKMIVIEWKEFFVRTKIKTVESEEAPMKKKMIPLNKIVVENINPFLGKDQIIEVATFPKNDFKVIFHYHDQEDCLMIKIQNGSETIYHEKGGRGTYNTLVKMIRES